MGEYVIDPRATTTPFMPVVVALVGGTAKTVAQVLTPAATDIMVLGWSVSFDGASGTAVPVICQLLDGDVAATVTAVHPRPVRQQPAARLAVRRRDLGHRLQRLGRGHDDHGVRP